MKKVLSILLAVVLVFGMLPTSALTVFAAETETVELSFATTNNRDSQTNTQQVWSQNGITFTNNKASSSSNVANYSNPVRLYAKSQVIVGHESGKITQIVFVCNSASYATSMNTSIGTVTGATIAVSGSNVTVTFSNAVENFTVASLTAQIRLNSLKVTYEVGGEPACEHPNRVSNDDAKEPTCTEPGQTNSYYCPDCSEVIPAEVIPATGNHNYENGVCTMCGGEEPEGYTLVTNVADLKAGDQVVIVATGYNYALSTTQNSNNRGRAEVTKNENMVTFGDDVQILTLGVDSTANTYTFSTGSGYLYAAGGTGSNNHLKTETTLKIGYWIITIADTGVATIKAADTTIARNWLRYNNNNSIFSCYGSGQQDIAIYKLYSSSSEECTHANTEPIAAVPATCIATGLTEGSKCSDCGEILTAQEPTPLADHAYTEGACSVCGKVDPSVETKAELMTTLPGDGDKIIVYYPVDKKAMGTSNAVSTEPVDTLLPYNTAVAVLTVELDGENYALKLSDGTYLATGATGGDLTFLTEVSELAQWTLETAGNNLWYITNVGAAYNGNEQALEYYGGAFKTWTKGEGAEFQMALYLVEKGENACTHENTTEQSDGYAATCTEPGKTNSWTCDACGVTVTAQQDILAQGHNYEDGACTVCGAEEPERYYIATTSTNGTAWYMTSDLGTASTKRYQAVATGILPSNIDPDEADDSNYVFILTDNGDGTYYLQAEGVEGDNYLGWTSGNSGAFVAKSDDAKVTLTESANGTFNISLVKDNTRMLALNATAGNDYFAWYSSTGNGAKGMILIPVEEAETTTATLYGDVENITVDGDLYLDLKGHKATNVTANAIYAYDSSASAAAAGTGSITTSSEVVMDNTVNNIRYIALAEGEEEIKTYTFHVLEMKLSAVTLRAKVVKEGEQIIEEENGIYYKAVYACDDTLKGKIDSYGVVFSLDNMPGADFKTEENDRNLYTVYEKDSFVSGATVTSGSIFGIMKKDLENNADRGKMKIYANAYIIINGVNNGEPLMADVTNAGTTWTEGYTGVAYSLFDVMDKLDEKWGDLSDAQKTTIQTFYNFWAGKGMNAWEDEFKNIA